MSPWRRRKPITRAAREVRWERQRLDPPRCPSGWTIAAPDFVGVGTYKSGTSWWYQLIARHPDVVTRGHPKELNYFDRFGVGFTAGDAARYACWFPRPPGRTAGEWSPRYADDLVTPARLAVSAPLARILYLVRDPLDRYRSDVTMLGSRVADAEEAALAHGRYARQVENLLRSFRAEQMLLLQYEQCVIDPRGQVTRTYRFLGLDDGHVPVWPSRGVHVTKEAKVDVSAARRRELVQAFEPEVEGLRRYMPDLDLSLWPSFSHLR